uniref:E3 ubiquitin-protein ligase n=1 Tax=Mucochytrium quahogii TaxID=96639 RepID=A0A7S2WKT4_9STRA|mmetsp:Transcript_9310/g.17598  ORF Transcript_9310/g.17598 Transcript_9310/m.17598 type:complete len:2052 (+) Transcript_9310:120-6275(+)
MQRYCSSSSATSGADINRSVSQVKSRIGQIQKKRVAGQEIADIEIVTLIEDILDIPSTASSCKLINEVLFCKTLRGDGQQTLRGSEGIQRLKSENKQARCGRLFRTGDLAYNCRTCQVDDTCVICQDCFNESEHDGHEVTFHRTEPGGCCDCGDEEAWDPAGFCFAHGNHTDDMSGGDDSILPEGVYGQAKLIVDVIFSNITMSLEEIFRSYARSKSERLLTKADDFHETMDEDGKISVNVVLNNDDLHTYQDVKRACEKARDKTQSPLTHEAINAKTRTIDQHGRAPIYTANFSSLAALDEGLPTVFAVRDVLEESGLLVCISYSKQLVFERRAIAGLNWMTESVQISQALARVVVDEFLQKNKVVSSRFAESYMRMRCGERHFWPKEPAAAEISLIEAVLNYDGLMPKMLISAMKPLWLSLLTHLDFKHYLGGCFIRGHRKVASAYSVGIGTRGESSLDLSVQLLTVPSIIRQLETELKQAGGDMLVEIMDALRYFLWSCRIRKKRRRTSNELFDTTELDLLNSTTILHQRYIAFVYNIRYVLRMLVRPFSDAKEFTRLEALMEVLKCVQRMDVYSRHLGREHVLLETDNWIRAFNLSLAMNNVCRPGGIQLGLDLGHLVRSGQADPVLAIREVATRCYASAFLWKAGDVVNAAIPNKTRATVDQVVSHNNRCLLSVGESKEPMYSSADKLSYPTKIIETGLVEMPQLEIVDRYVFAGAHVSHHLPVHRVFATFVLTFANAVETHDNVGNMLSQAMEKIDMVQFFEDVGQVFAANAQINSQLWRRNGFTMDNIVCNYKGLCAAFMYQNDIAFAQIAAVCMGPKAFICTLLAKFHLESFLSIKLERTVLPGLKEYEPQLADELLRLVIHVITEIPVSKSNNRAALRRAIVHTIATADSPCTFSQISDAVRAAKISYRGGSDAEEEYPLNDLESEDVSGVASVEIEKMLNHVAIKQESGLASWTYSLKAEIWEEVDPYYWNNLRRNEELLAKRLCETMKKTRKSWPMTGVPPGPTIGLLSNAREMVLDPIVVQKLIHPVFYNTLVAHVGKIRGLHKVVEFNVDHRNAVKDRVSPGIVHSSLHLLTLLMHHVGTVEQGCKLLCETMDGGFSMSEITINLEAHYLSERNFEWGTYLHWCGDQLASYDESVEPLRAELGIQQNREKKSKKKKKKKANRGQEAQRLAMERMKAAQSKALEAIGEEHAYEDETCNEENYCVLCHEHLEKKPYAHLGHARNSSWGHVLEFAPSEQVPPGVLTCTRKPAGWWYSDQAKSRSQSTGTDGSTVDGENESADWGMSNLNQVHFAEDEDEDDDDDDFVEGYEHQLDDHMEDIEETIIEATDDMDEFNGTTGAAATMTNEVDRMLGIMGEIRQTMGLFTNAPNPRRKESPLTVVPETERGVFVSFCSHAMHVDCLQTYIESLKPDPNTLFVQRRVADYSKNEFLCPMCKTLSNIIVPQVRHTHQNEKNQEKRRRLSSANADEMARFITGELVDVDVQMQGRVTEDIKNLMTTLQRITREDHLSTDWEDKTVVAWEALSFSATAREAVQRPMCGIMSASTGSRDLLEMFDRTNKQWRGLFDSAVSFYSCGQQHNNTTAKSFLQSPVSLFLNTFQRASNKESSSTAKTSGEQASRGGNPLFEMLTCGACFPPSDSKRNISHKLAPGGRTSFVVQLDVSLLKADSKKITQASSCKKVRTGEPINVMPGDEIIDINEREGTMTLERQTSEDGILLNVTDPVTLLVGLLSSLPADLHVRAAGAVALATLVQTLLKVESVALCESSKTSPRQEIALLWLEPLRKIVPSATPALVYYTLFGPLARYLRSSVALLSMFHGGQSSDVLQYGKQDEVEALWLIYLGLPPIQEIVRSTYLMGIIERWKLALGPQTNLTSFASCCLERTRLGLISLPENYELLLANISKNAKCPTTGKPVRRPALCLRCGVVVCSNSQCCRRLSIGAGTLHASSCGGGGSVFLLLQKCMVVLVHGKVAVEISAPYVDAHGETDDYLRRGRPLKLYEQAYRNLQYICANNEICQKVMSNFERHDSVHSQHYLFNMF